MLSVLRQRSFAVLWVGGLVSIGGDWILYAALPFFVYERTGSTIATAGMIAAELGPGVIVGSIAGVYVDRLDRRNVLIAANLLQAVTVTALVLVGHGGRVWPDYFTAANQ
jgi:predicted MFS family arabinose efflux permease